MRLTDASPLSEVEDIGPNLEYERKTGGSYLLSHIDPKTQSGDEICALSADHACDNSQIIAIAKVIGTRELTLGRLKLQR
jgi:hypothetical protein